MEKQDRMHNLMNTVEVALSKEGYGLSYRETLPDGGVRERITETPASDEIVATVAVRPFKEEG